MPNVHVQTAATNLRQAVNDVRLRQKQIHDEIDRIQREAAETIREKEQQRLLLLQQSNNPDEQDSVKLQAGMSTNRIDVEEQQIKRDTDAQQRELEKQIQELKDQEVQFEDFARQLDMIA